MEQIKNLGTTLNIRLKFRDYTEQIKSLETKLYMEPKFRNYLCHYPYSTKLDQN